MLPPIAAYPHWPCETATNIWNSGALQCPQLSHPDVQEVVPSLLVIQANSLRAVAIVRKCKAAAVTQYKLCVDTALVAQVGGQ